MRRGVTIRRESWPIRGSFVIARGAKTAAEVLTVELEADGAVGRGECVPYARYGESLDSAEAQLQGLREPLAGGLDRAELQLRLPAGAARNAVDCALWDLAAKRAGRPVWALAGLPEPQPLPVTYTVSLDSPEAMAEAAAGARQPLLKLKLGRDGDLARVAAVRARVPDSRLIVDANEAWTFDDLRRLAPALAELGVEMVEQPLPAGADGALRGFASPVPLCADESCHGADSLPDLAGKYRFVNLKLDKTGGFTAALRLREAAIAAGYGLMVGCMVGTSLAMAPAVLLAQGAAYADLDGPLLLAADRQPGLVYGAGQVHPPSPSLWG